MIERRQRHYLPLALTIAVHLLLFLCLYLARRDPPVAAPAGPRTIVFLLPKPASIRPPAIARAVGPVPAPAAPRALPAPVRDATVADQVAVAPAADAPAPRLAADFMVQAKRDVGRIDRQLRGATPPVPALRPDTPQARFEQAMAAAWIDRSKTMVVDHYTSPDGVIIERVTRGGGSACYMSGTVNFVPGILHDSSKPQSVSCPPPGSGWTRH